MGQGSRVMLVTGQLTDGSRGSRVTKCDSLSVLVGNTDVNSCNELTDNDENNNE